MRIGDASEAYLRGLEARNLAKSTQEGYRSPYRLLTVLSESEEAETLDDLDRGRLRNWREAWTCKPNSQGQRLGMLKAFFRHAEREAWLDEWPVTGLQPPRTGAPHTMPLKVDEMRELLAATLTACTSGSPTSRRG